MTETFEYDELGRLVSVVRGTTECAATNEYAYDPAGNRKTTHNSPEGSYVEVTGPVEVGTEGDTAIFTITRVGSDAPVRFSYDYVELDGNSYGGRVGFGDPGDTSTFIAGSGTPEPTQDLYFAIGGNGPDFVQFVDAHTWTIGIDTSDDTVFSGVSQLTMTLSEFTPSCAPPEAQQAATASFEENDLGPSFSISNVTVTEGDDLVFTVTKSATPATSQTHNITASTVADGSALAGLDFTGNTTELTFLPSEYSKTFTVESLEDNIYERDWQSFHAVLTNPTNGASISDNEGNGVILDNDPPPSFAISDVSVVEGGILIFTITKSGLTDWAHYVDVTTSQGTASSSDFTSNTQSLGFGKTTTSVNFLVSTTQDSIYEMNETVIATLSNPSVEATISDSQGIGTITDNDGPPSFAINDVTTGEGSNLEFTVTKTGSTSQVHDVIVTTAAGTASAGADFTQKTETLSFAAGENTKIFSITTIADSTYEPNETLYADLSSATGGASISDSRGDATITDTDSAPSFSVSDTSVTEGGTLSFTITKTGGTSMSHQVTAATSNDTATAGSDYTAKTQTFTFTPAQTSKTFTVTTTGDTTFEADEVFMVNLSNATAGATIGDGQGEGTITNDDPPPNVPPTAVNDSYSMATNTGQTQHVLSNDFDLNSDPLEITAVTQPTNATVYISADKQSVFIQTNHITSDYTFTYTISDGNGGTDTATVTLTTTGSGGWPPGGGGPGEE